VVEFGKKAAFPAHVNDANVILARAYRREGGPLNQMLLAHTKN